MAFVLDASIAGAWLLPDELHPNAALALDRLAYERALVPTIWWYEVRNMLLSAERRHRIDADRSSGALAVLAGLPISIEPMTDDADVLALARRHALSVYDAAYLALARRDAVVLATLDSALATAARAEAIALLGA